MKKRGYFFELDAALALFVLVLGAAYIASYYILEPEVTQVGLLSSDLLKYLSQTQIKNLDNTYAGIGGQLWRSEDITNGDNTLLQQAGEFYFLNKLQTADKFLENVTSDVIPYQYRYEIWIDDQIIYPIVQPFGHNSSKNATGLLLISRKVTYGIVNKTSGQMFGPYKAEVYVWQR